MKTVNAFSKDSSGLANLISFCNEMTGYMDKELHVIFIYMVFITIFVVLYNLDAYEVTC